MYCRLLTKPITAATTTSIKAAFIPSKYNTYFSTRLFSASSTLASPPAIASWDPSHGDLINNRWQPVIGLEIHAQINSTTKLFSPSKNIYNAPANTNVSLIDAAYPGTLPQLSRECVEHAVRTSLALGSHVFPVSSFDRKHYFYPDLPQGYQITQHYEPIAKYGFIELTQLDGLDHAVTVRIDQLQLEQDTGKSLHDLYPGLTLQDLNRAGTGLMEIVTRPDMRSSKEAGVLVKKLQALLRAVGSSDGNMDEGSMRCDVNVSVHEPGTPYRVRCELKNLNSIKSVVDAIDAEIARQISCYENNIPVAEETRGFDVSTGKTFKIRSKESAPDYRYMPEPDLPRLVLSQEEIQSLKNQLPELPDAKRDRIMRTYDLGLIETRTLMGEDGMVEYFEDLISSGRQAKSVITWTIHELLGRLNSRGISFNPSVIEVTRLGPLIDSVDRNEISAKIGKSVLDIMISGDKRSAQEIIEERGWKQLDNRQELEQLCEIVLKRYPEKVKVIQGGNIGVLGFIIGQTMKESKGRANPVLLNEILREKLGLGKEVGGVDGGSSKKQKKK